MLRFKGKIQPIVWFAVLCAAARGGVDLTPVKFVEQRDGPPLEFLSFVHNGIKIRYAPADGTVPSGGGRKLTFNYSTLAQASIILLVERKPQNVDLELPAEPKDEQCVAWVKRFAGPDAKDFELVEYKASAFPLVNRVGREIAVKFTRNAVRFGLSVGFVDLDAEDRLFILSEGREADFGRVRDDGLGTMYSWTPLGVTSDEYQPQPPPSEESAPTSPAPSPPSPSPTPTAPSPSP
jgi:hypothetical protein